MACYALGVCYDEGRGVAVDRKRALELTNSARQAGFALACGTR
ncbi:hypothetical protein CYFUS_009804 [Cystobacter fuscus]|uniref:Uncharacterized protein n=1 Tax=Cystobacter fuscus TaxID=43 RepID=A0A250JLG3_9BACT|nr:SEL1-like repeat protein [Cystobacter fuscus]ATB44317.1 hypothetical protein CYFUS_009804 [Cystobacter fuscus]